MTPFLSAARLALRAGSAARYRLRVRGLEHVPRSGPAVLVANHVSYADSLVLAGLVARPVRFLVYHRLHDRPELRWFFERVRAIPIAPASEDPARLAAAMDEARATLRAGELLGVFPEGQLTRTGEIGRFLPGVERILADAPAPVVPIALRGMWGSSLSRARPPFPRRGRPPVDVEFGAPLPAHATAAALERRVRDLRGDAR